MWFNKPVITITGTNGKGSCAAICEAILQAAGYKVGCYTSPHLIKFNERIRYNGQYASDDEIESAYKNIDKNCGYFEQATQASLEIFKTKDLDAYILEVGIGGRLDPVNRVEPEVSVITSIDLDHQDRLGNSREEIGFEKAHIFRAHKPAICGDANVPDSVKKYAEEIKAKLFCYQQDYFFEVNEHSWNWWNAQKKYEHLPLPKFMLQNAATALQALHHFPLKVSREAIEPGLKNAFLPGRCQVITRPILHILDVAHNPASARLLADYLQRLPCEGKTFAVVGMLKDKDISGTLSPLIPLIDSWHIATIHDQRGALNEEIAKYVHPGILCNSPLEAYQSVLKKAEPKDRIVIFGSFRIVGEIYESITLCNG